MQDIKRIFFDVGSTLIDETEAYNHRVREMTEGTSVTAEEFNEKKIFFSGQNLNGEHEAIKFFGLTKTPWHKEDEIPYPDAEDILAYLHEKGYKLGIIANQSAGTSERLEKWGLLRYIDVVAASAELGVAKPDRAIFDKAFEMAECTAEEAVMIGDRLDNDIRPAKGLGMTTVWVKHEWNHGYPKDEDERPDYTVHELSELKKIFK